MITLAGLEAQRRLKGARWCKTNGVGAIRATLGPEQPDNVFELGPPELREYHSARREAQAALKTFCQVCRDAVVKDYRPAIKRAIGAVWSRPVPPVVGLVRSALRTQTPSGSTFQQAPTGALFDCPARVQPC